MLADFHQLLQEQDFLLVDPNYSCPALPARIAMSILDG